MSAAVLGGQAMDKGKSALMIAVFGPIVLVIVLVVGIVITMKDPPKKQTPVGAGAGQTGGANALGNMLAGHSAAHAASASEAEPEMVAPETLAQGFVLVVEDPTKLATLDSPIFIAGNFNNWNPGHGQYRLTPQSDLRWRYIFDGPPKIAGKRMEFKFTRGDWALEELSTDMSKISNRTLPMVDVSKLKSDEKPVIELRVARWGDERPDFKKADSLDPYRSISVSGTLKRLQVSGGVASASGTTREVLVWLPPGYDATANVKRTYPVLYLMDGQNVFEKIPGLPAEWEADESAMRLVQDGTIEPLIIVAVPHGGAGRLSEYMPIEAIKGVPAAGRAHVEWLVREVMPRVNSAFRTDTRGSRTAIGGSSLGAIIALDAATTRPEVFGMALCESPSLATGGRAGWDAWLDTIKVWPGRVYVGVGAVETGKDPANADRNGAYVQAARDLDARMGKAGVDATRRLLVVEPDGEHNEAAWARRFPLALSFLFAAPADPTK